MNFKTKTFFSFILFALSMNDSIAGMATYNRWTMSEINVCFAEKETDYRMDEMQGPKRDWKQKEKELLQSVLEEEYTVQRTGYTFVGFKDCQDTEKNQRHCRSSERTLSSKCNWDKGCGDTWYERRPL